MSSGVIFPKSDKRQKNVGLRRALIYCETTANRELGGLCVARVGTTVRVGLIPQRRESLQLIASQTPEVNALN